MAVCTKKNSLLYQRVNRIFIAVERPKTQLAKADAALRMIIINIIT